DTAKAISLESMVANAKSAGFYDAKEKVVRRQKVLEADIAPPFDPAEEIHDAPGAIPSPSASDWKDEPYIIDIPPNLDKERLTLLNTLLLRHPGERKVELKIPGRSASRRMRLGFGITLTADLEDGIRSLLTGTLTAVCTVDFW
ncbi:MAG TPA: hypothetical protein VI588_04390, partial [Candidatus Gracilibacteria bacterium]|nr:hypothetical protein [Candidatus Gracilibacteria bacterium]